MLGEHVVSSIGRLVQEGTSKLAFKQLYLLLSIVKKHPLGELQTQALTKLQEGTKGEIKQVIGRIIRAK